MKQVFSQNKFFLNCSPLEQFDSTSFYFFNHVVEFVNAYNFYLFEIEYSVIDYAYNEYTSFLGISTYQNFYLLNLIIFSFILFISKNNNLVFFQEFSHLFLGIFFALFFPTVYEFIFFTSVEAVWEGSLQVHFGLFFDENFISFLLAFFLLGGSEQEDDEDFLFESIDADFVDDITAPLFIANLGKNIEGNGELLIKISSIFSFVLINNLMGMLPYSDTSTSSLILTFWVALSIFVSLLTLMIRKNGLAYFFTLFMPSGCPLLLLFTKCYWIYFLRVSVS